MQNTKTYTSVAEIIDKVYIIYAEMKPHQVKRFDFSESQDSKINLEFHSAPVANHS